MLKNITYFAFAFIIVNGPLANAQETIMPINPIAASEQILLLMCMENPGATTERCSCEMTEIKKRTGANYPMFIHTSAAGFNDDPELLALVMKKYGIDANDPISLTNFLKVTNKLAAQYPEIKAICEATTVKPAPTD